MTFDSDTSSTSGIISHFLSLQSFLLLYRPFLFLFLGNLPHYIRLLIFQTLLVHDIVVGSFLRHHAFSRSAIFLLIERVRSFRGELATHAPLMILVLSFKDFLVAEILHRVFLWSTQLHLLYEVLLACDACQFLISSHGEGVLGGVFVRLIRNIV